MSQENIGFRKDCITREKEHSFLGWALRNAAKVLLLELESGMIFDCQVRPVCSHRVLQFLPTVRRSQIHLYLCHERDL